MAALLTHLDNDAGQAEKLIAVMLAQRDRWVRMLAHTKDRAALEETLDQVRRVAVDRARALWPASVAAPRSAAADAWITHARAMLTKDGAWRARGVPDAVKGIEELRAVLDEVQGSPPARYEDDQWNVLEAIIRLAPLAIGELRLAFARERKADFIEMRQAAPDAVEGESRRTDLRLMLARPHRPV